MSNEFPLFMFSGTLKEGFNASLEFDGRVRDVFVKVHHMRPQSPSSNIEVHVTVRSAD